MATIAGCIIVGELITVTVCGGGLFAFSTRPGIKHMSTHQKIKLAIYVIPAVKNPTTRRMM